MLMMAAMAQMETNDFFDFYLDDFEPRINDIRRHSVAGMDRIKFEGYRRRI
jgi:hypothetical protein